MYAMGKEYGIPGLKAVACAKFHRLSWNILNHAGLSAAIIVAYSTTPETDKGLRDEILRALYVCRKRYSDEEEIQRIISSIPELSYGLFRRLLEREMAAQT
ncbi:uncharacterized protein M437DRAFT_88159 [Aureobasidium melanogenum CBS 110374]|uniref:Uncharacterized protein n=1 Tax=Aureobasidium melanogenum (strain CBS 110374) TaxID=1043003 RepID=A0A074W8L0_AURM1|nr:uncharacterized protein M437DRAFT_88159 [Aureobasidium melanogenum CBS 110374]KEQ58891.1 hypothetical protein M437DRAFT_88159 [Aureobasidium melanogenum CBS 110374]